MADVKKKVGWVWAQQQAACGPFAGGGLQLPGICDTGSGVFVKPGLVA